MSERSVMAAVMPVVLTPQQRDKFDALRRLYPAETAPSLVLPLLRAGCDPSVKDSTGNTCLHVAAQRWCGAFHNFRCSV